MRFPITLLTVTTSIAALALPSQETNSVQHSDPWLPLVVTDFIAFQSHPNINLMSFISFRFSDPEPTHNFTIDVNCAYAVNGNRSLYMDYYELCSPPYGAFKYYENNIMLRRSWWHNPDTYYTAYAPSATNWTADNSSTYALGVLHTRTQPWYIPIRTIIA